MIEFTLIMLAALAVWTFTGWPLIWLLWIALCGLLVTLVLEGL